ncbi:uncharacterized protein BDR25DRAFT_301076 [Lindgomyces ingoldianus]|uniref:Uncharacterized protein n=1 Tax=Lindgomyces ingoldianus TaxID=673940 RepID=A0ACB6RAL3_9PLEO|nr:uncharacterized protein BDR25DRAFT_301076 [Lindgomyces ingoldianus]KAF2475372.1 hypothetical protein BDR25DRAFT_301076 [Lindgomyces ingoldianus]
MPYQLPTDPSILNSDPLGIHDSDDARQFEVLDTLLETAIIRITSNTTAVDIIPGLVEDIAYTIHGNGTLDASHLRDYLLSKNNADSESFAFLLSTARSLSEHFPDHTLDTLSKDGDEIACNGAQVNALLAHQFLGTLARPEGTSWGIPCFTDWFAGNPAHRQAVDGYLSTILDHFTQGGYPETMEFTFSMYTADGMPDPSACDKLPNLHLHVVSEESEPSMATGEPFVLVAANSQPGPGATATQEERLQSASPALSTSALFTPVLPDQAAVVTSVFPVHAAWKGHNRAARLERLFGVEERPWRHYILADALQLDDAEEEHDGLNDLQLGRVEREARKLFAAFIGVRKMQDRSSAANNTCVVEAGAWGCGAFGGNVLIKTVCMMIASAITGVEVHLTLLEQRDVDIDAITALLGSNFTARELWKRISSPDVRSCRTINDFMHHLGLE